MTTMQNVACEMATVQIDSSTPRTDPERRTEGQRRHDAGQRDGQDHQQRHRLPAEEGVAAERERQQRAEHEGDRRGDEADLDRREDRLTDARVVPDALPPLQRELLRRPGEDPAGVEGVDDDDAERHVDERQADGHRQAEGPLGAHGEESSPRPRGSRGRRCGGRGRGRRTMIATGMTATAAANGRLDV